MTPAELRASTIDLLTDARAYFDNLSDAEYEGHGRPVGNPVLYLCARITELLTEIEAQKPETLAQPSEAERMCRLIVDLSAGWDEHGATGTKKPYRWETVARMAMDYARSALGEGPSHAPKAEGL